MEQLYLTAMIGLIDFEHPHLFFGYRKYRELLGRAGLCRDFFIVRFRDVPARLDNSIYLAED